VAVIGSAVAGKADTDLPTVASIKSAPLADLVTDMLTNSDNNTAEMLLKSIGLSVKGVASTAAGAGVVVEQLSAWGYNTENLIIADGSGLDRSNRLTCVLMFQRNPH
jgi:D-alanyl-D-alanine carboxypeptidase/D-alanyl-D-alanine-endopeptidase (penicillin-binding protein 4)